MNRYVLASTRGSILRLLLLLGGSSADALDASTYAYPVKVSANGRYLVDQRGKPFFMVGDSAQSLVANLTYSEADSYLSNRQAKGFNTVNINLIEHKFAQGGRGSTLSGVPTNRNGDLPFTRKAGGGAYDGTWGTADFSTPNEPYFAFADSIIDLAAAKGMLVSLSFDYLGYGGGDQGWWADLNNAANAQPVAYNFGLFLGNRYKNRANLIWINGGDMFPPGGSEGEARLHKILEGIKAAGATQLQAGDWNAPCLSTDEAAFAGSMDLNAVYTYGIGGNTGTTYDQARLAYEYERGTAPNTVPAYLKETGYELSSLLPGNPDRIRSYQYWAVLSGATSGLIYGHRDIWGFSTSTWWPNIDPTHGPWQGALNSQGAGDLQRMAGLFGSLPWYNLVPTGLGALGGRSLVTAGGGTYGQLNYVSAAATPDGTWLVAYLPPLHSGSVTIDMTAMAGTTRARWCDPSTGNALTIATSLDNTGARAFTNPGSNGTGTNDWVLVLDVFAGDGGASDGGTGDGGTGPASDGNSLSGTRASSSCGCRQAGMSAVCLAFVALRLKARAGRAPIGPPSA